MHADQQSHITLTSLSFESNLRPQKLRAGDVLRVRIKNTGQTSESFTVTGKACRVKFLPEKKVEVRLRAGQSTMLTFQPSPPPPPLIGGERRTPLIFLVQSASGETKILKGEVCSRGRLSPRLAVLIFVLLLPFLYISGNVLGSGLLETSSTVQRKTVYTQFSQNTPAVENLPTEVAEIPVSVPTLAPTLIPLKVTFTPPPPHAGDVLYLTFDDGPSARWTQDILNLLAKYDAKATFFILGICAKEHPELIAAELQAGHSIAHHTWSHSSLQGVGFDGFVQEISLTNAVLVQDASPCIRLPYAEADAYTEGYASQLGMEIIWWDVDPLDWSSPGQESIENVVLSEVSPNDIILLHDGGGNRAQTVAALEKILRELRQEGYVFEALCSD